MTNDPYTNRELEEKWNDIKEQLSLILIQVTKTNGRVAELEGWRQYLSGASKVLTIIIVPLFLWLIYSSVV